MSDYVEINIAPQGVALIDAEDYDKISKYHWRFDADHGYVYTYIKDDEGRWRKTYLHRLIMNPPTGKVIDHINRNTKDNRKSNLQIVTQAENAMYQKRKPHKVSGYIGVRPSKIGSKWRSSIMVGGKEINIGRFNNRHDAAKAYNEVAKELLGDRADLNKIHVPKIALTGKARSGKSAVSSYLAENYGFTRYAFGDELKRLAHIVFDIEDTECKPRELYQFFGQVCREYDPEIWIKKVFTKINDDNPENILIEDIRQPNELARCRAEGYTIIRVVADEETRLARARAAGDKFDAAAMQHETERWVDEFVVDYEIDNNGTWRGMAEQIDVIMRELGMGRVVD